jgi:uncharacterized protein YegL
MRKDLTEIIFILDRSGSMEHLTRDTIGGFNAFIEQQKEADGEARLTTILFDDKYEVLHDGVDIKDVAPLTSASYFARGSTALLDAIGKAMQTVGGRLANTSETERPGKVILVITTDGEENASREYKLEKIREMIEHQKNVYDWDVIFLGANIDAVSTAASFGIEAQFAKNYTANSIGTTSLYSSVSRGVTMMRSSTDAKFEASSLDNVQ